MSWATEIEADTILSLKPGTDAWFAPGLNKTVYLTAAFRAIAFHPAYLVPAGPNADELDRLKIAQAELAFEFVRNPDSEFRQTLRNQGVKKFKYSKWEEEFFAKSEKEQRSGFPSLVENILSRFLIEDSPVTNLRRPKENIR